MDVEKKTGFAKKIRIETFFNFFSLKGPPSIFLMICDRRDEKCQSFPLTRQSGPTFGVLGCFRREYFSTLKSFCYFWTLDMAPTWAVPGLLFLTKDPLSSLFMFAVRAIRFKDVKGPLSGFPAVYVMLSVRCFLWVFSALLHLWDFSWKLSICLFL